MQAVNRIIGKPHHAGSNSTFAVIILPGFMILKIKFKIQTVVLKQVFHFIHRTTAQRLYHKFPEASIPQKQF